MIRLWTPADCDGNPESLLLRGLAEHIRGGERTAFCAGGELLAFLESTRQARPAEPHDARSDLKATLSEGADDCTR